MALSLPETADEIVQRSKNDVKSELPASNPALKNSWINALIVSQSNRNFEFYLALENAELEAIPDTADVNLERWAAIWGVLRNTGSQATGTVKVAQLGSAAAGVTIPANTVFVIGAQSYQSTSSAVTAESLPTVEKIEFWKTDHYRITMDSAHGFTNNQTIDFGTDPTSAPLKTELVNGQVIHISTTEFGVFVAGAAAATASSDNPTSPAILKMNSADVTVLSDDFGIIGDLDFNDETKFEQIIATVYEAANVIAVGGGADAETNDDLLLRFLDRLQNPIAHFNVAEIKSVALAIDGVTRVFVDEAGTGTVLAGEVDIWFMRDNDADPIPDAAEVVVVDTAIQAIRPAQTASGDVNVNAPTPVTTAFTFSAIAPDSTSMRAAVDANLLQFYAESTSIGVDIVQEAYDAAIFNTIDTTTGLKITSFALSAPVGDITITAGEIGKLGTVSYP